MYPTRTTSTLKLKTFLSVLLSMYVTLALSQTIPEKDLKIIGKLDTGAELLLKQNKSGDWGIVINIAGNTSVSQEKPARISIFDEGNLPLIYNAGYKKVIKNTNGFRGQIDVVPAKGVIFTLNDLWTIDKGVINVERTVHVSGNSSQRFTSSIMFETGKSYSWGDLRYFIPSIAYGYPENVNKGQPELVEVNESRMTAPITGIYFNNGTSVAICNFSPKTAAPGDEANTGGMGARTINKGGVEFGYWLPAADGGDKAKSTNPIRNGFTQQYKLTLRVGRDEKFRDFYTKTWRLAWEKLNPKIYDHDIAVVRRSLIDMLADQVKTVDGRTGIPNFINWNTPPVGASADWKPTIKRSSGAILGFTGKNIEAAVFLIMDAAQGKSARDSSNRQKGLQIINSFLKLKVAPPIAEGFNLNTGELMQAIPLDRGFPPQVYLRSFGDDIKILLSGYIFEKRHGREHPEWLHWCKSFADWLLTQQYPDGGFPRSWVPGTGEIRVAASQSSYNAVPMLVLLGQITKDQKYYRAAERAAEFCWSRYQVEDYYVGGTIDNPNVQDKEAATLSVEAYLALYEFTHEEKWLLRAKAAANNAETYIYIWEHDHGVPTIGTNKVVASINSGADMYMSYDVDEYAKLYKYTGDKHYYDVARLLLHNTKAVMGIPGRTFDLPGVGWQTEDSKYPTKGKRGNLWLPWVATEHLNGILLMEQFDPALFKKLSR